MDILAAALDRSILPGSAPTGRPDAPPGPVAPVALVLVPLPAGEWRRLPGLMESLRRSRGAGQLPVAPGALAVLILADDPVALAVAEDLAPNLPFPLRVTSGAHDLQAAVAAAAAWARALGVEGLPLLIADPARPAAARWAYDRLAALRDGADVVARRAVWWARWRGGAQMPEALSGRAQAVMLDWMARRPGAAPTRRDSPWRRPRRAGLRTVAA